MITQADAADDLHLLTAKLAPVHLGEQDGRKSYGDEVELRMLRKGPARPHPSDPQEDVIQHGCYISHQFPPF